MDLMRNLSRGELAIDVCLTTNSKGPYEDEFRALGGIVHRCPMSRNPWFFGRRLRELLLRERYDVVHSHLYYFSGVVLRAAAQANVPQRVAHNHPVEDLKAGGLIRSAYVQWMRRWMIQYATDFVGPTRASLEAFCGPNWQSDPHKKVLYNGVRMDRFLQPVDRLAVRKELDISPDARIILNVGRFVPHKRQSFLVDVAKQLLSRRSDVVFLLIGDGPLREDVESLVHEAGLAKNFRFLRGAPDIDRYWLSSEVFAFPSINEGFGIVIVEAAAAGLPVIAQNIPGVQEAATACENPALLPLDATPAQWADAIVSALDRPAWSPLHRAERLRSFPFTIESSIESLKNLYHLGQPGEGARS
jgi:glycosyltransferase involved in cell wall biosynthesis